MSETEISSSHVRTSTLIAASKTVLYKFTQTTPKFGLDHSWNYADKPENPFVPRELFFSELGQIEAKATELSPWLAGEPKEILDSNLERLRKRAVNYSPFIDAAHSVYSLSSNTMIQLTMGGNARGPYGTLTESQSNVASYGTAFLVSLDKLLAEPQERLMVEAVGNLENYLFSLRESADESNLTIEDDELLDELISELDAIVLLREILL